MRVPREVEQIEKPKAIVGYTAKIGAVDGADHYCSSYSFQKKTFEWWRKIFFWLLEVNIVNSFICYNQNQTVNGQKPISHKKLRNELIRELVENARGSQLSRKRVRQSSCDTKERLNGKSHFIANLNGHQKTAPCVVTETFRGEDTFPKARTSS